VNKKTRLKIEGKKYRPCVLKILGRNEKGQPKECVFVQDDERIPVKDGDEFLIVFAEEESVLPKTN